MSSVEKLNSRYPCLAMRVESDRRVGIPAEILRALNWGPDQAIDLQAVMTTPGLVTLRLDAPLAGAADLLEANPASLSEREAEQLRVLADAYRAVRFARRDGRVRLSEEMLLHLGHAPASQPWLFIQAAADEVLIMSEEFRRNRLAAYHAVLSDAYEKPG